MKSIINNNFIKKLESKNFEIGSFDAYIDDIKTTIKNNHSNNDTSVIINKLLSSIRGSIINKDNNYIGFIGIYETDYIHDKTNIYFESNTDLTDKEIDEIYDTYYDYLKEYINIYNIEDFYYISPNMNRHNKNEITITNIEFLSKFLIEKIDDSILDKYSKWYNIPSLEMTMLMIDKDDILGIIGLSNVIWSNKRANLNIFLSKEITMDKDINFYSNIINDYLEYVHNNNIYNVTISISGSNEFLLDIIYNSKMSFYGLIPYGSCYNNKVESCYMFQHVPNLIKAESVLPNNKILRADVKKELPRDIINLSEGYRMICPKVFKENNINIDDVINEHIRALQNREKFSIPIAEDKYFIKVGNEDYGISKMIMNYSYILFDKDNNYVGFITIIRENIKGYSADIELGIRPELQHKGLGFKLLTAFYEELFSRGYISITSQVFDFNEASIKLHEKVATYNGTRVKSYYIKGKFWDMRFYTKVNPIVYEI